ncbi:hypothetical protein C8R43DRAFT_949102 [Mycena crocata]|nr:hypothetical protein C8R43DRAFT_949102 [Mycena crocata]
MPRMEFSRRKAQGPFGRYVRDLKPPPSTFLTIRSRRLSIEDQIRYHSRHQAYQKLRGDLYAVWRTVYHWDDIAKTYVPKKELKIGLTTDLPRRQRDYRDQCKDVQFDWICRWPCSDIRRLERLSHLSLRKEGAVADHDKCAGCPVCHSEFYDLKGLSPEAALKMVDGWVEETKTGDGVSVTNITTGILAAKFSRLVWKSNVCNVIWKGTTNEYTDVNKDRIFGDLCGAIGFLNLALTSRLVAFQSKRVQRWLERRRKDYARKCVDVHFDWEYCWPVSDVRCVADVKQYCPLFSQ